MNILQEIITYKAQEVSARKEIKPAKLLESSIYFETPVVSMTSYLKRPDLQGIIAEIKRKSPSAGMIHEYIDVEELSIGYMQAGASALSVLSDEKYFGGSNEDVTKARKFNYCPILRKDFIIDPYQVIETKSIGADCLLLIAAALDPGTCRDLAKLARELGLEVLLEVHNKSEIESHVNEYVNLIGVNNRDLRNFSTSIGPSVELAAHIPIEFVKISESGITSAADIMELRSHGYRGFLIGGYFMSHAHPEEVCARLIRELQE